MVRMSPTMLRAYVQGMREITGLKPLEIIDGLAEFAALTSTPPPGWFPNAEPEGLVLCDYDVVHRMRSEGMRQSEAKRKCMSYGMAVTTFNRHWRNSRASFV